MQLSQSRSNGEGKWRTTLLVVAVLSLAFNLTTRFCVRSFSQTHTVQSIQRRVAEPKRQHLNKDASRWIAPKADFSFFEPATVEAHVSASEPLLSNHLSDESLYNRPPPSYL